MDEAAVACYVYFEEPFWIGIVERMEMGTLSVCKITFGAEPKDYHIYEFLMQNYHRLRFSPAVRTAAKEMHANPKKRQREIQKQVDDLSMGTKSQQALKLLQEETKTERRIRGREYRELEKQRQFDLKQQKKKEKHRGR